MDTAEDLSKKVAELEQKVKNHDYYLGIIIVLVIVAFSILKS